MTDRCDIRPFCVLDVYMLTACRATQAHSLQLCSHRTHTDALCVSYRTIQTHAHFVFVLWESQTEQHWALERQRQKESGRGRRTFLWSSGSRRKQLKVVLHKLSLPPLTWTEQESELRWKAWIKTCVQAGDSLVVHAVWVRLCWLVQRSW